MVKNQESSLLMPRRDSSNRLYGSRNVEREETNSFEKYSVVSVLLAAFILIAVKDGTIHARSVFEDTFENETNADIDTVKSIGTTELFISNVGAPLAASLISIHGPHRVSVVGSLMVTLGMLFITLAPTSVYGLFIAQSFVSGLGFAFTGMSALAAVKENFKGRRFLALSFAMCGGIIGQFIVLPFAQIILNYCGWQFSMYGLAGVSLSCLFLGQTFTEHRLKREAGKVASSSSQLMLFLGKKSRISSCLKFLPVILADILVAMALMILCWYLQPVAHLVGIDSDSSAYLLPLLSATKLLGLLVSGYLSDLGCYHPLDITTLCVLSLTLLPALIAMQTQFWMFALYTSILGFLAGFWIAATTHVLVSLIGLKQFTSALSTVLAARSVSVLVAPVAVNVVILLFGKAETNFLFLASLLFSISCCLYTAMACTVRRHSDIVREEDGVLEWDEAGEEWDQDEWDQEDGTCDWKEKDLCQPCDSPCPEQSGRRRSRSEVGGSCLLSCEEETVEVEVCQPCDYEEGRGADTESTSKR